jgi:hypothetical protein
MVITSTISGSASCNLPNCPTANHTPHASICFSSKHTGNCNNVYASAAPYADYILAQTSDTSWDAFDCFESGSSSCDVTISDGIDCTIGGANFFGSSGGQNGFAFSNLLEPCSAAFKWTITPPLASCPKKNFPNSPYYCDYPVTTYCSNTTNPDFKVSLINDLYITPPGHWFGWTTNLVQLCFRFQWSYNADGTKKWYHLPDITLPFTGQNAMIAFATYFAPPVCTYTP